MKRLWDISPPVSATSPVFPGDTAYTQKWKWSLEPGCPVNVSEITMSPHIGAHADAPLHYANGAQAIGAVALEPFLGLPGDPRHRLRPADPGRAHRPRRRWPAATRAGSHRQARGAGLVDR